MTQNPFDALGGAGGLDLGALMQQAQQMQADLAEAQERLAEQTVDGTAGGVTVTLSGGGELVGVRFAPDSIDISDPEALHDLGDLVVAAHRDAKNQVDRLAGELLGPIAGGLGGPGGPGGAPGPGLGQLGF